MAKPDGIDFLRIYPYRDLGKTVNFKRISKEIIQYADIIEKRCLNIIKYGG